MKMETIIRSPQNGIVAKMVHKEGVSSAVPCVINWLFNAFSRIFVRLVPSLCYLKKYVTINFTLITQSCLRHKLISIELGSKCNSIVNIRQSHHGTKSWIYLENVRLPWPERSLVWCRSGNLRTKRKEERKANGKTTANYALYLYTSPFPDVDI